MSLIGLGVSMPMPAGVGVAAGTPATVPAQVGTVTPTAGDQQVALSWSAPDDGGSAITDYSVQYSTDDATWSTFAHGTTATTSTVTGLTNGTLYYFRVAAINAVGTGAYSASVTDTPTAPFSPLDLSPTMWFDASDETTITESGGAVSQWDDKSGNNYDLVQATSSAQPKTGTTTINSLNVLEYDGSNTQYLDEHTVNVSASHTMFAVYEISSNDGEVILVSNDSQSYWGYAADEGSSSTTMKGSNTIGGLYIDGSEWLGTTRGDLFTSLPKDSPSLIRATFTFPQLGWSTGFTGTIWAFSNGTQVAEIIVVASPTAQEISDTETYLANKWGITL